MASTDHQASHPHQITCNTYHCTQPIYIYVQCVKKKVKKYVQRVTKMFITKYLDTLSKFNVVTMKCHYRTYFDPTKVRLDWICIKVAVIFQN